MLMISRRCVHGWSGSILEKQQQCLGLPVLEDALVHRGKGKRKVAHGIIEITQHLLLRGYN